MEATASTLHLFAFIYGGGAAGKSKSAFFMGGFFYTVDKTEIK